LKEATTATIAITYYRFRNPIKGIESLVQKQQAEILVRIP